MKTLHITDTSFVSYDILPKDIHMSKSTFEELWAMRPTETQYVVIAGKRIEIPRKQKAYGISYTFSGQTAIADSVPTILQKYLDHANTLSAGNNMILVNWYETGEEYIGFHADDELQILPNSNIYGYSFGAMRTIRFKHNDTGQNTDFDLANNSVFIMGGTCQKTHKHSLLKTKKVLNRRISLTIRAFVSTN